MFNEILKCVDKFINGETFGERLNTVPIARYLSLAYDIPADSIAKVSRIKMEKIPDVILVSIDYELQNRICDYIFYEGELVKVISFSPQYWVKSEGDKIAIILALFGDINNSIIDAYRSYINPQMPSTFTDTLTYAPFIMAMAYIQTYLPFVDNKVIAAIFKLMYPKVTEESIKSARKLLLQFTVSDLLDQCIWYGVTNKEYPDIRSCELQDTEVKSAVPGKGVWNMSDMEDEEEFPEEELEDSEEEDDYPFNEEEIDERIQAQEDSDQQDTFTVKEDNPLGYDPKRPISYNNFPGGEHNI